MDLREGLALLLFLNGIVLPVSGFHGSGQCAQFGQTNSNTMGQFTYNNTLRPGPYTVGAKLFDAQLNFLDYAIGGFSYNLTQNECPYVMNKTDYYNGKPRPNAHDNKWTEFCVPDSQVEIRTYAVEQDGKIMNGWLHFEVELKDTTDKILGIYVQVRDEYFNAIGEFVDKEDEHCPPVTQGLATPTEYSVFPCSAVGFREAKTSTALYLVDRRLLLDKNSAKFLPKEEIHKGIHFTWRLHEYWCNRHLRFRPEAIIITEKLYNKKVKDHTDPSVPAHVYRKAPAYWIHHGWYGTADIKLPLTTLTCDKLAIDYTKPIATAVNLQAAPWLTPNVTRTLLENDYISKEQYYQAQIKGAPAGTTIDTIKSCQHNVRDDRPLHKDPSTWTPSIVPTFAGRCPDQLSKNPDHDALQGCNLDATSEEFTEILKKYPSMQTYSNYTNTLYQNRTNLCSTKCMLPTADNISDILGFHDTSKEINFSTIERHSTFSRNSSKVEKFFTGRRYHAVTCVIWSMFLVPVGIFCARYLKETCMKRECSGIHFWFWVHLGTTIAAVAMFITSLSAIASNVYTWGRSEHPNGSAHRTVGYISIFLFSVMLLVGGLRGIQRAHRLITATLHSVLGFLIYILNLVAILYSCFIPASPSMDECDENGDAVGTSKIFYVVLCWLLMDLCLHVVMSLLQFFKDRSLGIQRPWWCPIFPVLEYDSAEDMIGSSLRKIMLLCYSMSAFIFTNTAAGLILESSLSQECKERLGPLTCKEPWGCSPSAMVYKHVLEQKGEEHQGSYVFEWLIW